MTSPIPFFRLAGAVLLASAMTGALSSPAAAVPDIAVDGIVRTLAADTVEPGGPPGKFRGHSEDIYRQVLTVGGKSYFLKGKKALMNNSRVRAIGAIEGRNFTATEITTLSAVEGMPQTGTTRILAMLAYWTAPDSVTQASTASQLFSDSNGWFRDASYNALGQTGDVTPWLRIPAPVDGCYANHMKLMDDAKAAASARGYATADYDNFVLYFPKCAGDSVDMAGWAYIDSAGTWLNGYMDRRVTVHEQGHNYGLYHSHSNMCSNGGISGSCVFEDYGDPYDAMGSSDHVGHFNASQKAVLGWLSGRTVDLTDGGTATLVPLASDSATSPRAALIRTDTGRQYWLEYRQPIDFDDALPPEGTDGVLVHVSGNGSGSDDTGAGLIDVRPSDGISQDSSTLRSGQSWTTPEGARVAVGQVTATGASITVTGAARKDTLSLSPSSVSFGNVPVRSTSASKQVTLTNPGTAAITITSFAITGAEASHFVKSSSACGSTLAAGASCTVPVAFRPTASGNRSATFTVGSSAAGSPHSIPLTGTGIVSVPTVTAKNPAPGATGVSIGTSTARTPMTATFSEGVTGVTDSTFTLKQGATAVSAAVSYNAATRVATLTPASPLVADRTYTLALTSTITSASGGALAAQSWTFITGPRPTVTATSPAAGATGVSIGTSTSRPALTATFSEAVTGLPNTAASTGNYTLKLGTTVVASKVSYTATTRTATLRPDAALLPDRTYTLTLTSAVKDVAGNSIAAKTWTFVTGLRPTVTARTPSSGATGISRTANATATFSEPVTGLPTSAGASGAFTLKVTSTGAVVASTVSYNTTTRVATLNPSGTLLANTKYTLTLTSAIKDTAGNTFTALSWTFTTGSG